MQLQVAFLGLLVFAKSRVVGFEGVLQLDEELGVYGTTADVFAMLRQYYFTTVLHSHYANIRRTPS